MSKKEVLRTFIAFFVSTAACISLVYFWQYPLAQCFIALFMGMGVFHFFEQLFKNFPGLK